MPVIELPDLAHGANATLPPGAMSGGPVQGALWRELRNLRPHEGYLRPREALRPWSVSPPTFLDDEDQEVLFLTEVLSQPYTSVNRWLMVTSREAYIVDGSTWYNVTPTYSTGTVSVTNGATAVTGVGTAWDARRIAATQQIELPSASGSYYEIGAVVSDTSITLATAFTGTTLAGANYEIRRTFGAGGVTGSGIFAAELNGDLYVAGPLSWGKSGGGTGGGNLGDGAVLKILRGANPLSGSTSPSFVTSFLTSGEGTVEVGLDNHGYFWYPVGFALLPDGRLVVPVRWFEFSTPDAGGSRALYSSHLNPAVWTTSPGGFTDIIGQYGVCTAMTVGSRSVHIHHVGGIEVGAFTGADDPPLAFTPSRAHKGAAGPKMVVKVGSGAQAAAGEIFIASDRKLYRFSGDVSVSFNESANDLLDGVDVNDLNSGFSRYDSYRHEACFLWRESTRTVELRVPMFGDSVYEASYPSLIYAAGNITSDLNSGTRGNSIVRFGISRLDDALAETNLIYELREDSTTDSVADNTGGTPTTVTGQALSDFFILEPMGEMGVVEIVVWVQSTATASTTLDVDLIRDGTTVALASTVTLTSGRLEPMRFHPEPPVAGVQHQLRINNTNKIARIARVQIFYENIGSRRAT